ncbi:YkvA family protein [Hymenobacter latericus]|uniref:YkvA family protein n=1 Tax=Hymenobacter sp. YIM 151858-1 TaxID=2987688 RepID=UPI00222647D8|nr:YkvA family protein [Hymenobacter sp. YIM 151858-1]UYZ58675.1 YkvA family protein [Hymenobacter sp. YIM 151858-1]
MATNQPNGEQVASSPLFKGFLRKAEGYLRQPLRIKQLLSDAYHKASEKKELGHLAQEAWESLQTLFRLVRSAASGEYHGVPTPTVLGAVAVLIYFMSPIDLVPDFIPVVGLLDDVALLAWFTSTLKNEMDKFEEWERTRAQPLAAGSNLGAEKAATDQPLSGTAAAAQRLEQAEHSVSSGSFVESPESAKRAGRADLPGGSQPDPANQVSDAHPEGSVADTHHPDLDVKPNPNVEGASTAGSRDPKSSGLRGGDTGGNVR